MDPVILLSQDQCPEKMINIPYQEAGSSMLWPAVITCPNIQLAVGILSQFTQNPAHKHWEALKWVISYLNTMKDLWLTGGCWIPPQNLLGCQLGIADCHSISGFVARLGWGAVTWLSKCQMLVAQLSMEAEYIVVPHTTWEICWLRSFLAELRAWEPGLTKLLLDNQSTIAIVNNNKFHAHTKHIDIQYHFIHKAIKQGTIAVDYVPTSENVVDSLMKLLPWPAFKTFIQELAVQPLWRLGNQTVLPFSDDYARYSTA